jgi:hypothetical protein
MIFGIAKTDQMVRVILQSIEDLTEWRTSGAYLELLEEYHFGMISYAPCSISISSRSPGK